MLNDYDYFRTYSGVGARGRTQLWVGVSGPKGQKWGLVEQIGAKFGGLLHWFLWQNANYRTDFWPKLRFLELDFDQFLGLGTEKFAQIRHFEWKIGKCRVIFWLK